MVISIALKHANFISLLQNFIYYSIIYNFSDYNAILVSLSDIVIISIIVIIILS